MSVTAHRMWPRLVVLAGLGLTVASVLAWVATGSEGYTRWPDAKLEAADKPSSPEDMDLLEDIGLTNLGDAQGQPKIESRFALGLLPGGFTPRYLVSVASMATVGVALCGIGALVMRRGRGQPKEAVQ